MCCCVGRDVFALMCCVLLMGLCVVLIGVDSLVLICLVLMCLMLLIEFAFCDVLFCIDLFCVVLFGVALL